MLCSLRLFLQVSVIDRVSELDQSCQACEQPDLRSQSTQQWVGTNTQQVPNYSTRVTVPTMLPWEVHSCLCPSNETNNLNCEVIKYMHWSIEARYFKMHFYSAVIQFKSELWIPLQPVRPDDVAPLSERLHVSVHSTRALPSFAPLSFVRPFQLSCSPCNRHLSITHPIDLSNWLFSDISQSICRFLLYHVKLTTCGELHR